jgi:hypothetical protein
VFRFEGVKSANIENLLFIAVCCRMVAAMRRPAVLCIRSALNSTSAFGGKANLRKFCDPRF